MCMCICLFMYRIKYLYNYIKMQLNNSIFCGGRGVHTKTELYIWTTIINSSILKPSVVVTSPLLCHVTDLEFDSKLRKVHLNFYLGLEKMSCIQPTWWTNHQESFVRHTTWLGHTPHRTRSSKEAWSLVSLESL